MRYIPALDGLRGIAVILVIVGHAWESWVPAGAYGVTIFFVLSGYLITRVLISEIDDQGAIDFRRFFLRRAVRLGPALLIVVAVYLALRQPFSGAVPVLGYFSNYATLVSGDWNLLHHTWSLAVEEHFYLAWPFVIAFIPAHRRMRMLLTAVVLLGAWRGLLIVLGEDMWVYYATDTNAYAILAGCLAAVVPASPNRRMGSIAAVILVVPAVLFSMQTEMFLWAGFAVTAFAAIAVTHADKVRWLEAGWLRWIGRISYGLYLWHYVILRSGVEPVFGVALSVVLAGLMWHKLEKPLGDWVRRGLIKAGPPEPHTALSVG